MVGAVVVFRKVYRIRLYQECSKLTVTCAANVVLGKFEDPVNSTVRLSRVS